LDLPDNETVEKSGYAGFRTKVKGELEIVERRKA